MAPTAAETFKAATPLLPSAAGAGVGASATGASAGASAAGAAAPGARAGELASLPGDGGDEGSSSGEAGPSATGVAAPVVGAATGSATGVSALVGAGDDFDGEVAMAGAPAGAWAETTATKAAKTSARAIT